MTSRVADFFKNDACVTQNDRGKGGKTTAEATHVGLFTSHFSFPKDPPPTLQFVYFSPHPVLLFYPGRHCLLNLTTSCHGQTTQISEREPVERRWSVNKAYPIPLCVCVAVSLELCPTSALTSMFLLAKQQIEPQLDPEIPRPPPPPSNFGDAASAKM